MNCIVRVFTLPNCTNPCKDSPRIAYIYNMYKINLKYMQKGLVTYAAVPCLFDILCVYVCARVPMAFTFCIHFKCILCV